MKKLSPKQMKIAKVAPPYTVLNEKDLAILRGKKKRKKK